MDRADLWTKDFITGTFTNFFLTLNYYILIVTMAVYARDYYGSTPSEAGFASSIFIIGALAARLMAGRWIERIGRKKMLMLGIVLNIAMTMIYFVANNIWVLLAVRFLHGMAYGASSTAVTTIVTQIVPKSRKGEGVGYYMLSLTLGSAVGPFLGMYTVQHGGFTPVFIVCSITALLSLANAYFLSAPEIGADKGQVESSNSFRWNNFFEPKAVPICTVCAILYFCYSSVLSFLTPFAQEIDLMDAASFFFIVYSGIILVSRPTTGRLFDQKGPRVILFPAFFAIMVGMILLSLADAGVMLLAAGLFIGFGMGVIQSCGLAIAVQVTAAPRLALANSTFYVFIDAGIGVGPVLLGMLLPLIGYRGMYMSLALVAASCALLYYFIDKKSACRCDLNQ